MRARTVEGPQALGRLELEVGAPVDEQAHALRVALPARNVQRRAVLQVDLLQGVQTRRGEEEHDAAAVAAKAGNVERRAARRRVAHVRVRAAVQQQLDARGAAALAREQERRVALLIRDVGVVAALEQLPHALQIARRERAAHEGAQQVLGHRGTGARARSEAAPGWVLLPRPPSRACRSARAPT